MHIYFSGIGGVGLGPLAEIALDAGYTVSGSDAKESSFTEQLRERGVSINTDQSGAFLGAVHQSHPIDWFVHTSALALDHPELGVAGELGIRITKRDEMINQLLTDHELKMIAIAGTHGKTTTTGMMVWVFQQLGIPVSYSIGTEISFGASGHYEPGSQYFIYECDEYDRNFLHYSPYLTLITSIDYDHPDSYPTQHDYTEAFNTFLGQSQQAILWQHDTVIDITPPSSAWVLGDHEVIQLPLAGQHNRANASLVLKACEYLSLGTPDTIQQALTSFPGTARRFERLADNLYTDYGHHPVEIAATLQLARELNDHVVLVYQPHQNTRQHTIRSAYTTCMDLAEQIYWLPTFQSREDLHLPTLTPEQLTERLTHRERVVHADMNPALWQAITEARAAGKLVLCMSAGTLDGWLREQLANNS